jgi:hypothetical protein
VTVDAAKAEMQVSVINIAAARRMEITRFIKIPLSE